MCCKHVFLSWANTLYHAALQLCQSARLHFALACQVRFASGSGAGKGPPYPLALFTGGFLVPSQSYETYAQHLASYGYTVLLYDKRARTASPRPTIFACLARALIALLSVNTGQGSNLAVEWCRNAWANMNLLQTC